MQKTTSKKFGISIAWLLILFAVVSLRIAAQDFFDQPLASVNFGADISHVAWHPGGDIVAVASSQGIYILTDTLQAITQLHQNDLMSSVAWSPSGDQLAVASDSSIEIWNWDDSTQTFTSLVATLHPDGRKIKIAWSPNGLQLASISLTYPPPPIGGTTLAIGSVEIWDTETWSLERTIAEQYIVDILHYGGDLMDWNPQGLPTLVIVGNQGRLDAGDIIVSSELAAFFVDTETGITVQSILLAGPFAYSVSWQPTGNLIGVGGDVGVDIFDVNTRSLVTGFPVGLDIQVVNWNPDGQTLLGDNIVFSLSADRALGIFASTTKIVSGEWNPDGKTLIFAGMNGDLQIEDPYLLPGFSVTPSPTPLPNPTVPPPSPRHDSPCSRMTIRYLYF